MANKLSESQLFELVDESNSYEANDLEVIWLNRTWHLRITTVHIIIHYHIHSVIGIHTSKKYVKSMVYRK